MKGGFHSEKGGEGEKKAIRVGGYWRGAWIELKVSRKGKGATQSNAKMRFMKWTKRGVNRESKKD